MYQHSIDKTVYREQLELIEDEISLAQLDVHDARLEELDIKAAVNYATDALATLRGFGFNVLRIKNRTFSECCFPVD